MISVIIPVFNQADKIGATLESITKQSNQDLEVIIVNDGSSDKLDEALDNFFRNNKVSNRWFVINQSNHGAPHARNRGFEKSQGDLVFFCDADAVLIPDALATMKASLFEHPEASYIYSSFLWGKKLFKVGPFSSDKLRQGPCIHTMSLIRREHFPKQGWDESVRKLQDWDLYLSMLEEGHIGFWIDKVLFRVQTGGVISSWLPSFAYKLFPWLSTVKKYNNALAFVKQKHGLA